MSDKNVDLARKSSLLRLVDVDNTGTIDAQEFAVLYDAIKKDLLEDAENNAALEKEASSATRRFKMLLLFVAVLVSFLAASVAANFAVLFTFVDSAITTATTGTGLLEVKGSDAIVQTAIATQDVPLLVAPVLDLDTLAEVKSLKVVYSTLSSERIEAQLTVVGVRKHNSTFVEFVTSVPGETVQTLNGDAELVRYPSSANGLTSPMKYKICSANATCSALRVHGIDVASALEQAREELNQAGFHAAARRLAPMLDPSDCVAGFWAFAACSIFGGLPCPVPGIADTLVYFYSGYLPFAVRHVVFMLHGWGGNAGYMWNIYCTYGWFSCPALEVVAFQHLAFVFPSSAVMGHYDGEWGMAWNPDLESTPTMEVGAAMLSTLMCGNPLAWSIGYCFGFGFLSLFGVGPSSEAMIFGFSNGGAMAEFANWAYGSIVTKGVSIDYLSQVPADASWVPTYYATSGAKNFNLKVYFNCDSWLFTDYNVPAMQAYAGLTSSSGEYTAGYGGWGWGYMKYREWTFTNPGNGRSLTYAVHGWDNTYNCHSGFQIMCPGCSGEDAHITVPYFVDLVGDVASWLGATTGTAASPPPKPPSPSPPPFPPLGTWFIPPPKAKEDPIAVPAMPAVPWEPIPVITTIQVCKKVLGKRQLREILGESYPTGECRKYPKGDLDKNGRFDPKDIDFFFQALHGEFGDPYDVLMPCGDMDWDGKPTPMDAEFMKQALETGKWPNGRCGKRGDINKNGVFDKEDLHFFDTALHGEMGDPMQVLMPCGDLDLDGKPTRMDLDLMEKALHYGKWPEEASYHAKMEHLEMVYEEQALDLGWVEEQEDGTIVSNIRQTKEEALSETWVAAPAAPPPPPISECEDQVVTINAPQKALKYDARREAALRLRLDSVLGKRVENFAVVERDTTVLQTVAPLSVSKTLEVESALQAPLKW